MANQQSAAVAGVPSTAENAENPVETSDSSSPSPAASKRLRLMDLIDEIYEGKEVFFRYVRTVEDLMNDVKYLTVNDKVKDGVHFLKKNSCRHILVVDIEEPPKGVKAPPKIDLIGVVSQRDLARALSRAVGTLAESEGDQAAMERPLASLSTRNPHTVRENTSLAQAIEIMVDKKIDCLPVIRQERTPVGLVTTDDIVKCFVRLRLLRNARSSNKSGGGRLIDLINARSTSTPADILVDSLFGRVGDLMQASVVTVRVSDKLGKAMELMVEHQVRHLPVLDPQGNLKGILSDRDIAAALPPLPENFRNTEGQSRFRSKLFAIDESDKATAKVLDEDVSRFMTASPVAVDPLKPISEVADLFCSQKFSAAPVVAQDKNGVAGIVTQTDFLCAILAMLRLRTT